MLQINQQMITWQKTGRMAGTVSIFLMHPNGQTIKRTIAMSAPNTEKYLWDGGVSIPGNQVTGSYFVWLPHHNKYGAAFKVKCSTGKNFHGWDDYENPY